MGVALSHDVFIEQIIAKMRGLFEGKFNIRIANLHSHNYSLILCRKSSEKISN